jgi:A/G-specific adenine glycosylase
VRAEIEAARLRYYRSRLTRWFAAHGRDLPWRRTRDPYRILVSEILLHQTQAPRVAEVYRQFVRRFPSLRHVAAASLGEVKDITDPLGYKVRGAWIKRIADEAVTYRAGRLPATLPELRALPGVGRYTAGAVMTFAYGEAAAIVDTNVARVLGRWFAGALPPDDPDALHQRRLWALAEALLTPTSAWAINQGLMDLGAQLCTARAPACARCPLRRRCHYPRADGGAGEAGIVVWLDDAAPGRARQPGASGRARRALHH